MTLDDGVLVSRRWLERVNQALFGHSQIAHEYNDSTSLFYDVRPAILASAWTQNAAGVYQATAQFIVNDAVDSSFTFHVVAPTATDDPGGEIGTTRFFVIWRGRWEMIAGASGGKMTGEEILEELTITSAATVTGITPTRSTVNSATGNVSGSSTAAGTVTLTLNEDIPANPGVGVVVDILATAQGALGVETKKLAATFNGTATAITATAATTPTTVLSNVTATRGTRIVSITAKE